MTDWDRFAPPVPELVRPVRLDPKGKSGPTRVQARGNAWRRAHTGWYVTATAPDCIEQHILEESIRTSTCVVTGWAALRVLGAGYFDGLGADGRTVLPVPIIEGAGRIGRHPTISLSRHQIDPADIVVRHGIRVAVAERAVVDEMRRVGELRGAVRAADLAFAAELTSIRRVREHLVARPRRLGPPLVHDALALASESVLSPQEPPFRMIWVLDAGWPPPLCNPRLVDTEGLYLGRPDLLDVKHGIAGEYNGAEHRTKARYRQDVKKEAAFRRVGLEYFTVVGDDLHDPRVVVARMEEAKARAGLVPRAWRLAPERESLDERLDRLDRRKARDTHMTSDAPVEPA